MTFAWFGSASRDRRDADLDAELRAHLRMAEADRMARGESPEAAAAGARREFGNVGEVKHVTRQMWSGVWLEGLMQDLRFGFRMLRRSPGFSILAILCLTLGIGANAAVYSWIEGVLLRPYPKVVEQDRLLVVAGTVRGAPGADELSWPDFLDLKRNSTLFEAFVADKITGTTLSIGDRAERVPGQIVSANYFDAIGVRPFLGRGFEPAEETGRNAHPVVVIAYKMWHDRFESDPQILGKTQLLNGLPHTIIGVAPQGFNGTFVGYAMQFWIPASMQETFDLGGYKLEDRGAHWVESFARLKPGVTREQAQAELAGVAKRLESAYPQTNKGRGIELYPLWKSPFNNAGGLFPTLRIALVVAFFVLLVACANVSNLLLVRAFARQHEMTVRLAVGSGRGRLVRQLVTEGLILSSCAAIGGLLVAYWCRNLLVMVIPPRGVAMNLPATTDWRVLVISAGVCLLTTLLFGLVPAFPAGKINLASAIKAETGGVVGGSGRSRIRSGLVLLQVSLSFILVVGAGLLIKSLQGMRSASPGFSTQEVLIAALDLNSAGYDVSRKKSFQDELMNRVQAIPGVQSAAYARVAPFSYVSYSSGPIVIEGYQAGADEQPAASYDEISPAFFATVGIPLVSGRDFTRYDDETAPFVAIVNEALATSYWPGLNPIGRFMQVKGHRMQVVGVARMAKYDELTERSKPFFYVPLRQNFAGVVVLHVRTSLGPAPMGIALAREIHALDPGLAPARLLTMREQVDRKSAPQTVALSLVSIFGGLALVLAGIGLYGVMSYAVSQNRRELGLRMALGAGASDLLRLVMKSGLALTGGGVALGAAAALVLTRLMGDLLYKVSPRDPVAFGAAFAVMAIASLVACFMPAWRASQTDPAGVLRQ
jgi:macrolide transport system ATP-binding/permease protein